MIVLLLKTFLHELNFIVGENHKEIGIEAWVLILQGQKPGSN